jgi:conjugal transfer pilus assembly protein TrbC
VPSFVLARAGGTDTTCSGEQCARSDDHVMAAGDVSLAYVLAHFQRAAPAFAKDAGRFLDRLGRRE